MVQQQEWLMSNRQNCTTTTRIPS